MNKRFSLLLSEFSIRRAHELSLEYKDLREFKEKQKKFDILVLKIETKYPEISIQINELIEHVNAIDAIYIEESFKAGFRDCYNFIKILEET